MLLEQVVHVIKQCEPYITSRQFDVSNKVSASDYLTSMDVAIEAYLKEHLLPLVPGSGFVGEESDAHAVTSDYVWVVDPIDGTSNFVRDLGLSVISVALLYKQEPVLAVIYHATRQELFTAEKGRGAYCNGVQLHVSERDFAHAVYCTAFSMIKREFAKPCMDITEEIYAQCDDFRRLGAAALELAQLAAGRVELYFEMRLHPWDYAAGQLLIEEAGGYVGTIGYARPVFNRPIPFFAANSKESFDKICAIIERHVPTIPYED